MIQESIDGDLCFVLQHQLKGRKTWMIMAKRSHAYTTS